MSTPSLERYVTAGELAELTGVSTPRRGPTAPTIAGTTVGRLTAAPDALLGASA